MVFNLESSLDANIHKATCRRSTFGRVVMCADALLIVFPLGADMRYALIYGKIV